MSHLREAASSVCFFYPTESLFFFFNWPSGLSLPNTEPHTWINTKLLLSQLKVALKNALCGAEQPVGQLSWVFFFVLGRDRWQTPGCLGVTEEVIEWNSAPGAPDTFRREDH